MRKKIPRPKADDDLDGIEAIDRLAGWARVFIWVISGTLGIFFAWIQLKDVPFIEIAEKTPPEAITTTALIIYYACWIGGTNFDVKIQQKVYVADPKHGHITTDTIIVTTIFLIVTALLLWASKDTKAFAILLAFFVVANIFGWRHIVKRVRPAINSSRAKFKQRDNLFRLEQLHFVENYMAGPWQMHRFWGMLGMILVINIICFIDTVRLSIGVMANRIGVDLPPAIIAGLLPGILILGFVLIAEMWIWIKRVNVRTALIVIDNLRTEYKLEPIKPRE